MIARARHCDTLSCVFPPPGVVESPGVARLRGLAIAYLVLGGFLLMLGLTFALFAVVIVAAHLEGGPPLAMCVVEAVMMTLFAAVLALGARGLYGRKDRTMVKAAAVTACLIFPIGTVIGVLTFRWVGEDARLFES